MSNQEEQRTGLFTLRREVALEHQADRKGQTTELFLRMAQQAHAELGRATDDGRKYQVVVEIRMTTLVDPSQARIGEHVCPDALQSLLGKIFDDSQTQASGLFLAGTGLDEYRHFKKDAQGLWRRVAVPQGYKGSEK